MEDGFVSVGSAFQTLETDEDIVKAKEKKEKEFYVFDKQGRRRFHGAFTGGFSAGYYNTVGTKEGWSPAPFVSSRGQTTSSAQQRPEDYMDEEDFDMFGIAPHKISTSDKFTQEKQSQVVRKRPAVIPGDPPLQSLIVPAKNTIGAKLLKSMGWKEGQGTGPLTSKTDYKVYGCHLPGEEKEHLFAPRNTSSWVYQGKDNLHGIDYSGMTQECFSSEQYNKGIYGMSGQAFGVGALEEEDDDLYSQESISSYHISLATDNELTSTHKFGWTGDSGSESWSLSSFVKSSAKQRYSKTYLPLAVPKEFVPVHKFNSTNIVIIDEKPTSSVNERACVTGEIRSVFDLITPHDKERLKRIKKSKDNTDAVTSSSTISLSKDHKLFSFESYKPFSHDPSKQLRYESYIKGSIGDPKQLTEWEKQKELEEFHKISRIYTPNTSLSDKFTHGRDNIEQDTISDGTTAAEMGMFGIMTRQISQWHPHRMLCRRFNIPNPYPHSDVVGIPKEKIRRQPMEFDTPRHTLDQSQQSIEEEKISSEINEYEITMETQNEPEKNVNEETEEEILKPSLTLLKSIFAETSSDSEPEEISIVKESTRQWQNLSEIQHTPIPVELLQSSQLIPVTSQEKHREIFGPILPVEESKGIKTSNSYKITRKHHKHHKSKH